MAFSCGSEFFLFRTGNRRDGCLNAGVGFAASASVAELFLWSVRDNPAIGFSTPDVPFDFCSCAFFFRAAARACNFDILGAPSDEPPRRPPRGYRGAMKIVCRSAGILYHGVSLKNSENENGFAHVFKHSTIIKY